MSTSAISVPNADDIVGAVLPVDRVAAVVNAVTKHDNKYYGSSLLFLVRCLVLTWSLLLAASDSRKNGIAAGY
jgi:hypothetical protein